MIAPHPRWSLVTVVVDGEQRAAIASGDRFVDLPDDLRGADLLSLLSDFDALRARLEDWTPGEKPALEVQAMCAPLLYPRKVICAGANYADHLTEMNVDLPDDVEPFFFLVPPSTTIIGPGEPIRIPDDPAERVDWEAELAVVIGRRARHVTPQEARGIVAGYAAFNDISARGRHRRERPLGPPFAFDWLQAKGQDTFCPMGPGIVPDWLIPNPHDRYIRCWVNGELKQDGNTGEMLNDCWQLIAAASERMTLEPGDVIATGTPSGVGAASAQQLKPGDRVVVEIEGIGRLENPVAEQLRTPGPLPQT